MPEIIPYLLKANLAIILFYLGYRLLLRKLTFYTLNRFYLLFALFFSLTYPLIDVAQWFAAPVGEFPDEVVYIIPDWQQVPAEAFNGWPYLIALIAAGILWFAMRLVMRLLSLRRIHRQSHADTWHWVRYRRMLASMRPFSFWRNIYVNVENHPDNELVEIFRHEQVHVSELHTVDILLAELGSVLCWFNPGIWLLRHAIRENLEFITDRNVLRSGIDKQTYQYSLVGVGRQAGDYPAIAQGFNFKSLKRRITMMNKARSSRFQLSRYLLAVPVIAILALLFTMSRAASDPVAAGPETGSVADTILPKGDTTVVQVAGAVPSGEDEPLYILDGNVLDNDIQRNSIDPNTIESISVLKGASATELYGDRGGNGVVIITTKAKARQDTAKRTPDNRLREITVTGYGADEATEGTDPDSAAVKAITVVGYKAETSGQDSRGSLDFGGALIVIDGKESTAAALKQLSPDDIASIDVLKGAAATSKYGDKGKKGVVEIATKR